jgi:hypothetical protein
VRAIILPQRLGLPLAITELVLSPGLKWRV